MFKYWLERSRQNATASSMRQYVNKKIWLKSTYTHSAYELCVVFACLLMFLYTLRVCLCQLDVSVWKLMQVIIHFMLHSHWIMSQTVALGMFTFLNAPYGFVCLHAKVCLSVCVCVSVLACVHMRVCTYVCMCAKEHFTYMNTVRILWMNSAPQSTMKRWTAARRDNAAVFIKYTHTVYTYRLGVKAEIINILSHTPEYCGTTDTLWEPCIFLIVMYDQCKKRKKVFVSYCCCLFWIIYVFKERRLISEIRTFFLLLNCTAATL